VKRKEPASFQDLVMPLFRERKKEAHLTLTAVRGRWEEIVGPDLARKTYPLRVHRGVLWVGAPDASWAYQFQFMRSELLHCLEAVLGATDIHEVRFKATELPASAAAAVPDPAGALDSTDVPVDEGLARSAETISDPALRALFVRSLAKQRQNRLRREAGDGAQPKV
jgi:hypothetical protein